jgi:predicted HD superfamily hydrolase involved in NAD metabolism
MENRMDESMIRNRVREALSAQRFEHVEGVVATAARLAERYGEDPKKARLAAWIHDYAREWPVARLRAYAERLQLPAEVAEIPNLVHGPVAAHLAEFEFGVDDPDVANAIRYHTTGRVGMSRLEKILCLADAIEPGRQYPGVDRLRSLAENDLTQALAESFDATIEYLIRRREPIFPGTVMARNALWAEVHARDGAKPQKQDA